MSARWGWMLMVAAACAPDPDRDGFGPGQDCAPDDPTRSPNAVETCDGVDNDCDGWIDEDVSFVAWLDADGDGFGDPAMARRVCRLRDNGVTNSDDCDDAHADARPGGVERCDGLDNDCDGAVDEDVKTPFYADEDGDGHGAGGVAGEVAACALAPGFAAANDDCEAQDPAVFPGAPETCDGRDNDCDGVADEGLPVLRLFVDADGDGAGSAASWKAGCAAEPGWSLDDDDCDDADPTHGPFTAEIADNGQDEDCDGWVDEIAVPEQFPTLDLALASAEDGAVVQVGPGLWGTGAVDLRGRDLTLAGVGCATQLYAGARGAALTMDAGAVRDLALTGGSVGGLVVSGPVSASGLCVTDNATSGNGGGLWVVEGGALTLEDSLVARNVAFGSDDYGGGGGARVDRGELIARRVRFEANRADVDGGAVYNRGGHVVLENASFVGNRAGDDGGALAARTWLLPGGTTEAGSFVVRFSTFQDNECGDQPLEEGAAVYTADHPVDLYGTIFADHPGPATVVWSSGGAVTARSVLFWNNGGRDFTQGWFNPSYRFDPRFVAASGAVATRDLRLRPGDARDLLVDATDVDGSPAEIGAFGGMAAGPVATALRTDSDGDGVRDEDEVHQGSSPWRVDAGDADGDGLDAVAEVQAGTSMFVADSDGDGVDDGTELASGTDPRGAWDRRPTVDAGGGDSVVPRVVAVGVPAVAPTGLSYDPDGVGMSFAASVLVSPGGVAAPTVDARGAWLTPDAPGLWQLRVDASDGAATGSAEVVWRAVDVVRVPGDYPDLSSAIAAIDGRGAIALGAGTWGAPGDLGAADLTIVGEGRATVVTARDGSAFEIRQGALTLDGVDLACGDAEQGGCVWATDAAVSLRDVRMRGGHAWSGGAVRAHKSTFFARDVWVDDASADQDGGAMSLSGGRVDIARLHVRNARAARGGALAIDVGSDVEGTVDQTPVRISNAWFEANEADDGAALYLDGRRGTGTASDNTLGYNLRVEHCLFTDHGGRSTIRLVEGRLDLIATGFVRDDADEVVSRETSTELYGVHPAFDDVSGEAYTFDSDEPRTVRWGGAALVSLPDVGWLPGPGAAWTDGARADRTDRDGSPLDIGPGGGPDAPVWANALRADGDGDGLPTGWEAAWGHDPGVADAHLDLDLDGLDGASEYLAGASPTDPDSDDDGWTDGDESAAGSDPLDPSDHAPIAEARAPATAAVGERVVVDGSASYEPDGDVLTYAWSFRSRPAGSALTDADLGAGAEASFVGDVRGTWEIALRVTDASGAFDEDVEVIDVLGPLDVPAAFGSVAAAAAAARPGEVVRVGAGRWPVAETVLGSLTVEGQGADTVLVGQDASPAFRVEPGASLTLRDVVVAEAVGNEGGAIDCGEGFVAATAVEFRNNAAYQGGALSLVDCTADLRDVAFANNETVGSGGAIYAYNSAITLVGGRFIGNVAADKGGAIYQLLGAVDGSNLLFLGNAAANQGGAVYSTGTTDSPGALHLDHASFGGNVGRDGSAIWQGTATGVVRDSLFLGGDAWQVFKSGAAVWPLEMRHNAWFGGSAGAANPSTLVGVDDVVADPRVVARTGPAATWDLRLHADSPLRGAADPATAAVGPVGGDIGAWGGPGALAGAEAWITDGDGDGLPDAWEAAWGLDPAVAGDDLGDVDGDGLSGAQEHALGTAPVDVDTDADGVEDGAEWLAGADPADPVDHAPALTIGADVEVDPGEVRVSAQAVDPDGATVGVSCVLAERPGDSAAEPAWSGDDCLFLADRPGRYVVRFTAIDEDGGRAEADAWVTVRGALVVPGSYTTLAEATARVAAGGEIVLGAGTFAAADVPRSVWIRGSGVRTVIDGGRVGPALALAPGVTLTLEDLVLRDGAGARGGCVLAAVGGAVDAVGVRFEACRAALGGAVAVKDGSATFDDVRFEENRAARTGGGVHALRSAVTVGRTHFTGNEVDLWDGGGIYVEDGSLAGWNLLFAANRVGRYGGGIRSTGLAAVDLRFVTATGNGAGTSGAFAYAGGGSFHLDSSVVAYNAAPTAIVATSLADWTQGWTIVWGNVGSDYSVTPLPAAVDGNVEADPRLVADSDDAWLDDDWRLGVGSAAINAGDPAVVDVDGSRADAGASGGPTPIRW